MAMISRRLRLRGLPVGKVWTTAPRCLESKARTMTSPAISCCIDREE